MAQGSLRDRAARGLLWGGLNNGLVQIIGALFGIAVLRCLTPQEYGKIYMLMVFPALASILQESGFTAALCRLRTPSHEQYNAVFWFNVGMGALLYAILWLCAPLIARYYADPTLLPLSRYLFLGFLVSSAGTVQRAYLYIHLMQRESCIIAITSLVASNIVGLGMILLGYSYWGLATQNILFILVVAVMNWWYSPWRPTLHIDLRPAWQMFGFSSRLLLTSITNTLSAQAFSFLFGRLYGGYTAGIYGNARKWTDMASGTINGMVSGVALPVLAQVAGDEGRYRQVLRKMLRFVSFVCFPAMLGLGLVAREFLLLLAGAKWEASASLLSLLCVYGALVPLHTLFGQMVIGRGRSDVNLWCTVGLSLMVLLGLWALHPLGVRAMVTYFVVLHAAWLGVWLYWARRLTGLGLHQAAADVLPFLGLSLAALGLAWWTTRGIEHLLLLLLAKVAIAAVCYLGALWLLRAKILRESICYLLRRGTKE